MTLYGILYAIAEKDGTIPDMPIIFRDEEGGWSNVSVKHVGSNLEVSVSRGSPFKDE